MWNFKKFKNNIALINNEEQILYKDLIIYSNIITKKIRKKSLTILLADNSLDSITCYISLLKKRFPFLILNNKISRKFLKKIIKLYRPDYICLPKKIWQLNPLWCEL